MPTQRDGRQANARASAPTFPPDDHAKSERPSHADSSHIARRRVSSVPAHEVDLDEVELFDEAPAREAPQPSTSPPLPAAAEPPSNAPFDVPIAIEVVRRRSGRRTAGKALAYVMLALAIGTAAGLVFRPRATVVRSSPPAALALEITSAPIDAAVPAATSEIPVVDVASLPRGTTGTVVGTVGHRLWIDGNLAASWQASVSCGHHVVQVGSAGVPRALDVPCGDRIVAAP